MAALSLVSAEIVPERQAEVVEAYREMVETNLPPVIRETFLLAADDGTVVETGVFGARMAVELVNDGPVTIVLD